MKILILRTMANMLSLNTYNLQEVGLAKALTRLGHHCDILYYSDEKKDRSSLTEERPSRSSGRMGIMFSTKLSILH